MSPELRDDLEIALAVLDRMRAGGRNGAEALEQAMETFRSLRSGRGGERMRAGQEEIRIAREVAERHGISLERMTKPGNEHSSILRARDEAAWLMRRAGSSYPAIGRALKRDHSSMIEAVRRFEKRLAQDELLRARLEKGQAA